AEPLTPVVPPPPKVGMGGQQPQALGNVLHHTSCDIDTALVVDMNPDSISSACASGERRKQPSAGALLRGKSGHPASFDVLSELRYLLGGTDRPAFATSQRSLGAIYDRQDFQSAPFSLFPQGKGFLDCVFSTFKSSGLNCQTNKSCLVRSEAHFA